MNKQQLANKIWESANKMRSKIEANEYKDYILGFIFYKYLSDNEVRFLRQNGVSDAEMLESLVEEDSETTRYVQTSIGYYIAYRDLFSTWISLKEQSRTSYNESGTQQRDRHAVFNASGIFKNTKDILVVWRINTI